MEKEDKGEEVLYENANVNVNMVAGNKHGKRSRRKSTVDKSHRQSMILTKEKIRKHPFRPVKSFYPGTKIQKLLLHAEKMLHDEEQVGKAMCLPRHTLQDDWLAVLAMLYYNSASFLYGQISEICECESMRIGGRWEYLWADGKTIMKPISIPALDYIENVFTWVEANFDDPNIFPEYDGTKRSREFGTVIKDVFKRLLRVYGHMGVNHHDDLVRVEILDEFDAIFKSFVETSLDLNLIQKASLEPVHRITERWRESL